MEIVRNIAAILALVSTAIALIASFTKSGRSLFKKIKLALTSSVIEENKQQSQDIQDIKEMVNSIANRLIAVEEVSKQSCRDAIKDIYYKYCNKKKIPLFERKTADLNWSIYRNYFKGNSYIALLYEEIIKWEIIPKEEGYVEEV